MSTETADAPGRARASAGVLAKRGAVALVLSVAVNAVITVVADAAGVAPNLEALAVPGVVVFTAVGVVGAVAVYAIIDRVAADPDRTFTIVAAVVLVLSWIPDAVVIPAEPGGTVAGAVVLAVTHLTAAVIAVALLTDRGPAIGSS